MYNFKAGEGHNDAHNNVFRGWRIQSLVKATAFDAFPPTKEITASLTDPQKRCKVKSCHQPRNGCQIYTKDINIYI